VNNVERNRVWGRSKKNKMLSFQLAEVRGEVGTGMVRNGADGEGNGVETVGRG